MEELLNLEKKLSETRELLDTERQKGIVAMIQSLETTTNIKLDNMHKETQLLIGNMHKENSILLNQILDQTKKTNGRVTKIEEEELSKINKKIEDLEDRHNLCPISNGELLKDYKTTKNNLKFFEWIGQYPKITISILIGIIFLIKFIPSDWILKYFNIK